MTDTTKPRTNKIAIGLLAAPVLAVAAALGVTLAAKLGGFTGSVGVYHAAVFGFFWGLYYFIPGGFENNFNTPGPVGTADVAYYTAVTHTTIGFGDIYPKTTPARLIVACHALLVFVALANIIPIGKTVFSYSTFTAGD